MGDVPVGAHTRVIGYLVVVNLVLRLQDEAVLFTISSNDGCSCYTLLEVRVDRRSCY